MILILALQCVEVSAISWGLHGRMACALPAPPSPDLPHGWGRQALRQKVYFCKMFTDPNILESSSWNPTLRNSFREEQDSIIPGFVIYVTVFESFYSSVFPPSSPQIIIKISCFDISRILSFLRISCVWNCVPWKRLCSNLNPQDLWVWAYLETGSLQVWSSKDEVIQDLGGP